MTWGGAGSGSVTPRMVLVHERFTEPGGSEQVVEQLASLAPNTRIFAPLVDRATLQGSLGSMEISSSGLQRLYRSPGQYAHLLPLLPAAMASADVSDADLVIASHHAFANRVRVPNGIPFVSYTHSPARWMWDRKMLSGETGGRSGAAALRGFAAATRASDWAAANRVDHLIANSRTVANRILHWWGRHATVIHPPVDVDFHTPVASESEDFFLVAGRLVPYKRADIAVAAANTLGRRLVVAGTGRSIDALQAMAGPTIDFVGHVDDEELRDLYRRCSALLFPGEEDFGIVPVEAQACGTPIIATATGGATETVVDGVTGILVEPESDLLDAFTRAMAGFDPTSYRPADIRVNAERFSRDTFRFKMNEYLLDRVDGWDRLSRRGSEAALAVGS